MNIQKLVEQHPNDMELGKAVRDLYRKNQEYFEKYKDIKIYESPDKGETVYERPFGGDISERKLVTKQLTIFDDENYKFNKEYDLTSKITLKFCIAIVGISVLLSILTTNLWFYIFN